MKKIVVIGTTLLLIMFLIAIAYHVTVAYHVSTARKSLSGPPTKHINISTNTWSSSFDDKAEKLAFLRKYIRMESDVLDAEYHIFFQDNSDWVPGPSYWDILVALKITPDDIPRWLAGTKKLVPGQIDVKMWDDLQSEQLTWQENELTEYYRGSGRHTYIVVYPEIGVVLKRIQTNGLTKTIEVPYENEQPGFDEYKELVAGNLGYDVSAAQYVKTRQVATGSLKSGADSTVIVYEMLVYGGGLYNVPTMVIITGEDIVSEVLTEGCYSTDFFLSDIDADGYDEVLVQHATDSLGGMGQYQSSIYKLEGGQLRKLSGFPDDEYFDTGFELSLSNE